MRTVETIPQYTTVLAQAVSCCGSYYAAATVDGVIKVWKTSQLISAEKGNPIVRQE